MYMDELNVVSYQKFRILSIEKIVLKNMFTFMPLVANLANTK